MSEGELIEHTDEAQIATEISSLPPLPEDFVRVVHLTNPAHKENLLEKGLDYSKYGMAMSMARAWQKAEDVEYWSDDPRYSYDGVKALVMDMSNEEWKMHNKQIGHSGIIPKERIVGFVDAKKK